MTPTFESAFTLIAQGQARAGADQVCALATQAVLAGRLDAAWSALLRARTAVPTHAGVLARLAGLAQMRGDIAHAQTFAAQALQHDPGEVMAATMRTDHLAANGEPTAAAAVAQAALSRVPDAPHLRRALALALLYQGRAHEAHEQAMKAARALGNNATALGTACMTALYDDAFVPATVARLHRELAANVPADTTGPASSGSAAAISGRPLRVGFVSADLAAHPVGWFIEPVLAHLPRDAFESHVYARVPQPDAITARLRAHVPNWRDTTGQSDAQVREAIARDHIDVLIDLGGHTDGARPRLFAGRAAPLQLAYLGYPFTSGLAGIDALIGDAHVLPPGCEPLYRERLLRLPESFLGMLPPADAPAVSPLPASTGQPFTFGSFNNLAKLSDRTVALWGEVLRAVPTARLALSAGALGERATGDVTLRRFTAQGVAPERLLFLTPRPKLGEFLAHYARIDLALDPLPFNGGTTTVHALWQGVPTLTLPGGALMNRMGTSIAHAAGLQADFVASSTADYVGRALDWSRRIDDLARLRAGMRERVRGTALFDGQRFAAGFAQVLREAIAQRPH